jgi:O-antigen/teichoic acid export membrane protein
MRYFVAIAGGAIVFVIALALSFFLLDTFVPQSVPILAKVICCYVLATLAAASSIRGTFRHYRKLGDKTEVRSPD